MLNELVKFSNTCNQCLKGDKFFNQVTLNICQSIANSFDGCMFLCSNSRQF